MLLKEAIKKLESTKEFKDFLKEGSDCYLAHAFTMLDNDKSDWQIGYYNKDHDRVVIFEVGDDSLIRHPEDELFKKTNKAVKKLDMSKVNIDLEKALNIAEDLRKEKYSSEIVNKKIIIIQNIETQMYNLTLVTHTFNIINIKIDASSGDIISESRQSILGLRKE
jgi:hypothetical protein